MTEAELIALSGLLQRTAMFHAEGLWSNNLLVRESAEIQDRNAAEITAEKKAGEEVGKKK